MLDTSPTRARAALVLPLVFFVLSGFSGLVLEIIWTRRLALVFGSTIEAVSTTVSCFMLGLGLGAALIGRISPTRNLLRLYGVIELVVGVAALLITRAIPLVTPLVTAWFPYSSSSESVFGAARMGMVLVLLLPACVAMGATLPLLTQHYAAQLSGFGRHISLLYGVNTLGAAVGAFAADFLLVPAWGVETTAFAAAALSAGVGLSALALASATRGNAVASTTGDGARPADPTGPVAGGAGATDTGAPRPPLLALLLVIATCGFCGMAYEIIWTRTLVFFNGSDVYAFSTVLGTYLLGIVVGSLCFSRVAERLRHRETTLGCLVLLLGAVCFSSILAFDCIEPLRKAVATTIPVPFTALRVLANLLVLLPSTVLLGALFPLCTQVLHGRSSGAAVAVGRAYWWNVCGTLAGSLLTGFVLLPALNVQYSMLAVSAFTAVVAVAYLFAGRPVVTPRASWGAAAAAVLLLAGMALLPRDYLLHRLIDVKTMEIIFEAQDRYGKVALVREWDAYERERVVNLIVDGFNMAGNSYHARRYASMLSLVPILVHENPRRVLVIALGLGNTAARATEVDVTQRVDCVELSAVVVQASSHMEHVRRALASPKTRLHLADGRNFLLRTQDRFDVITAEPPPPNHAGIVNLYSREYYELCRDRLAPGGLVAQWLPVFELSNFEARTMTRAFQDVFPYTYAWQGSDLHICLLGSQVPLKMDYATIDRRLHAQPDVFGPLGLENAGIFLGEFLKGPGALRQYTASTPPLTDEHPYIEYGNGEKSPDIPFWMFAPTDALDIDFGSGAQGKAHRLACEKAVSVEQKARMFLYGAAANPYVQAVVQGRLSWEIALAYPGNPFYYRGCLALPRVKVGDPLEGIEVARRFLAQGRAEEALSQVQRFISEHPETSEEHAFGRVYLAMIHGLTGGGRDPEARRILQALAEPSAAPGRGMSPRVKAAADLVRSQFSPETPDSRPPVP